ncbi:SEL1-like repeat protein [Mycoplasmatota bacterium]|nr:SEL1-like repeat protein [Mycoplasmatota bacterium]
MSAQLYVGCLYQNGFEIQLNKSKAQYWYEMAANKGSKEAQKQLKLLNKEER